MKKKTIFFISVALITLGFLIYNSFKTEDSSIKIVELRAMHEAFLRNNPFKETLKLSKKDRKKLGIPPNKYFEEQYLLEMNPALGRPTYENLRQLQQKLLKTRGSNKLARTVPGEKTENAWIERGPNNVGGRTRAIMFDPNDSSSETVFAGGVSGGLWKNTNISNANSQWTRVNIPENLAVSSITYDPNNSNVFYLGTGESYVQGAVNGDGLWKSADGGNTWNKIFGGISGDSFYESANNLTINSPAAIAGNIIFRPTTNFGTTITSVITADVILANDGTGAPTLGCTAFTNSSEMTGKIALIRRGSCDFVVKAKNAENAGAIAVIVMNNVSGDPIAMGGSDNTIMIPAVMISKADGDLLESTLSTQPVNVSLNPRTGDFTGRLVPGIQHINDVAVRNNAGVSEIYVAAGETYYQYANATTFLGGPEFGLYKSTDGGLSWMEVSLTLTTNGNKYAPNDIEIGFDNKIWVATTRSVIFGDGGGTILSSSDGNTFNKVYEIAGGRRTEIAVSKSDAQKIYTLAEGTNVPIILERTDDGFATNTSLTLPNDVHAPIPTDDFTNGQAFYNLAIEADPMDDTIVYVGGIDLFRSADSGTSWNQISEYYSDTGLNEVHPDQHAFVFHPTDKTKAVVGNDGGVYYATTLSGTPIINSRNTGYNVTQFYTVGVGPLSVFGADFFLAGSQDNGNQIFQNVDANDGPHDTFDITGGDGGYCFFDQDGKEAYLIVNIFYNDAIYLFDFDAGDSGEWIEINRESESNGSFINPQGLDSNLNILYSNYSSGANSIIKRYSGIKSEATIIKTDLTNALLTSRPTAFVISPYTVSSSKLLVGTFFGKVLKIVNADGDSPIWSDITGTSFVGSVSDIELGSNENEIFVTMHNYGVTNIWYTNDGGLTWQSKDGDLPDMPVKAILQNPLNYKEVIIGTDLGVWFTNNFSSSTPTWNQAYNGMSNVKVTDLDLREDNSVFASTYGRGVFSGKFELDPTGDIDGDGILNGVDICPQIANADQADSDGNGIGDVCQDTDNDTILDINDNCPENSNIDQIDSDGNGIGDACQDIDADGVIDIDDNCVGTANGNQNDTNGNGIGDACDTSYENPTNITLEIISETCEGLNNGKIIINTAETYVTYTAALVGDGLNLTQGFGGTYTFEGLAVGSYTLCITVDNSFFEQCFEINIDAAANLDVVFETRVNGNSDITSITINNGTPPFKINFNGKTIRTTSETTFEIEKLGSGFMEIYSSKACEGKATKTIFDTNSIRVNASPNPVINLLKVSGLYIEEEKVNVQIYNIEGKMVFDRIINIDESYSIQVPFVKLSSGMYFVRLEMETPIVLKIVKE